ncbi:unnamed protein product, partial [Effrenium voratum]
MELAGVGRETELRRDKAVPCSPLLYRVYLDNFDTLQKVNPSAAALLEGRPNGASLALRSVYEEFNVPRNVKKTVEQQLVAEMQGALRVALDVLQAPVGGYIAVESDAGARRVVEANFADVLQLSSVEEVTEEEGVSGLNFGRKGAVEGPKRIIDLVRWRPAGIDSCTPQELELWAADNHRGGDVSQEGVRFSKANFGDALGHSVQVWRTPGRPEHINKLELRALFTALKWRIQKQQRPYNKRMVSLGYPLNADGALRSLWVAAAELLTCLQRSAQRDDFSVSALVASYGEGGQWQRGQLLLGGGGVPYNAAISACDLADQWQMSLQLLLTACLLRLPPQAARVGAAAAATGAASAWRSAWRLWEEMQMLQLKANEIVCGSALRACGSRGLWAETLALRSAAKAQQVSNAICESMVTLACEQASLWRCALATLPSEPSMDATAMAIGACGSLRKWALALFLRAGGSESETRAALGSCASAGRWELALQLCDGGATEPGVHGGLRAVAKGRRWPVAFQLLRRMPRWRLAAVSAWSAALNVQKLRSANQG